MLDLIYFFFLVGGKYVQYTFLLQGMQNARPIFKIATLLGQSLDPCQGGEGGIRIVGNMQCSQWHRRKFQSLLSHLYTHYSLEYMGEPEHATYFPNFYTQSNDTLQKCIKVISADLALLMH